MDFRSLQGPKALWIFVDAFENKNQKQVHSY